MNSEVMVGTVRFSTPLLLASGFITETPEFFLRAQPLGCAGIVTRSLKEHVPPERSRIPAPRYAIHAQKSMLNCEWGNERPWRTWLDQGAREVQVAGAPLVISLSGRDPEGCARLMRAFDEIGVDAFEVNVSCSHSGALHGNLNVDLDHLRTLMSVIRPATCTPLWIKLSYSTHVVAMGRLAEELGADALVCTNSVGPGMLIDTGTARPMVGIQGGGGGLTGEAIFPIALWCVHQLANAVRIPIVGTGGIATGDHVIQMLMAGASVVELYTAPALLGPRVFRTIMRQLEDFMRGHPAYDSIATLTGRTAVHTTEHSFSSPIPRVIEEKCTGCALCVESCAFGAIDMIARSGEKDLAVINDACISCNACVGACPPRWGAIVAEFGET